MWDGIERRQFPRVRYPCLITVHKKLSPAFSILTHTENIGVGGVRVIVEKKIEVTTEVDLELDLRDALANVTSKGTVSWVKKVSPAQKEKPSRYNTAIKGTVSWVKEVSPAQKGKPPRHDTGIQFITLKDEDRARIATIVYHFKR